MKGHPLQNFKDMYVVNSYRFGKQEPIMSFQTNKNGTFNPIIQTASGTLKWVVDGVEQITNSPSYELIGDTVDVEVYANEVTEFETITSVDFISQNIIGSLDFSWFILNGTLNTYSNAGLTGLVFSSQSNVITEFRTYFCNISSLDLSNVIISGGQFRVHSNTSLSSIIFKNVSQSASGFFTVDNCNLSTLDLSNFTLSNTLRFSDNPLTSIIFSSSGNSFTTFEAFNTNLSSVDFSGFATSGILRLQSNTSLSSVTFSTNSNTLSDVDFGNCSSLTALDLSNVSISGTFSAINSGLTGITFKNVAQTVGTFRVYNCNLTGTLDVSNITFTSEFRTHANSNLSAITFSTNSNNAGIFSVDRCNLNTLDLSNWTVSSRLVLHTNSLTSLILPNITVGLSEYLVYENSLPLSAIDLIFSSLNTYFSTNTPIKDLTVNTSGGTNASPTGGSSNTDIVNLDTVVYPNAGFDFIYTIN